MLVLIGTIVAAYALARLVQVPTEAMSVTSDEQDRSKWNRLTVVSLLAAVVIVWCTVSLWDSGVRAAHEIDTPARR